MSTELLTPEEDKPVGTHLSLQQRRNYYTCVHNEIIYDVFEYLTYDGDNEPFIKRVNIYLHEECEEVLDKDLEAVILALLTEVSQSV